LSAQPKIGVGCYILKENLVLLGFRSNGHASGSWAAPGGHIEFGESPAQAATREAYEESGIRVPLSDWHLRAITNDFFPQNHTHYFTLALVAEIQEGKAIVREPHKLKEWDWFELDHLPAPLMTPFQNAIKAGLDLSAAPDSPIISG
jgi:8-oxo-dGTP diphosphatase